MKFKLNKYAKNHFQFMFWKISKDFEKFNEEKSKCLIVSHGPKRVGNNETALDSGYILNFGQT